MFDGLYNEGFPIAWAQQVIASNNIGSAHPFRNTLPAKLILLYTENNFRFIEVAENLGFVINADGRKVMIPGREPYFSDPYDVVPLPPLNE